VKSADSTPGRVTVHEVSRLRGTTDPEIQGATRQLAIMLAFVAASAALITFVVGWKRSSTRLFSSSRGRRRLRRRLNRPSSDPMRDLTAEVARDAVPPSSPRSNARLDA
jgi:hypothetical protein